MAFSHGYGQIPEEQYSIEAIRNVYEHGFTFFDTAEGRWTQRTRRILGRMQLCQIILGRKSPSLDLVL